MVFAPSSGFEFREVVRRFNPVAVRRLSAGAGVGYARHAPILLVSTSRIAQTEVVAAASRRTTSSFAAWQTAQKSAGPNAIDAAAANAAAVSIGSGSAFSARSVTDDPAADTAVSRDGDLSRMVDLVHVGGDPHDRQRRMFACSMTPLVACSSLWTTTACAGSPRSLLGNGPGGQARDRIQGGGQRARKARHRNVVTIVVASD
jgi:hypothetical protein